MKPGADRRSALLERYEIMDQARKMMGVGSVAASVREIHPAEVKKSCSSTTTVW